RHRRRRHRSGPRHLHRCGRQCRRPVAERPHSVYEPGAGGRHRPLGHRHRRAGRPLVHARPGARVH
ncbi:hypothetical protein LTR94_038656, partial [Friedmanniomyces endolithicus]